jgi:hypothetical protein
VILAHKNKIIGTEMPDPRQINTIMPST